MSDVQEGTQEVQVLEIKVSEVKALLEQGLDRKEIAKHFNKSVAEMARTVWSDPALKNLKKKAAPSIRLVNDEAVAETAVETEETVADNATEEVEQAQVSSTNDSQWK